MSKIQYFHLATTHINLAISNLERSSALNDKDEKKENLLSESVNSLNTTCEIFFEAAEKHHEPKFRPVAKGFSHDVSMIAFQIRENSPHTTIMSLRNITTSRDFGDCYFYE